MEKDQIIPRARELFMKFGIKSVTMDDVSRELGISKKTLYTVVENKRDLITQALNYQHEDECMIMGQIRHKAKDALDEMILMSAYLIELLRQMKPSLIFELNKYYRKIWSAWEQMHRAHIYNTIKENILRGQKEGCYRPDLEADIIAKLYISKAYATLDEQLFPRSEYKQEELYREHIIYHLQGIASELGLKRLQSIDLLKLKK